MSYKEPIIVNRQQWERQQEKLRIARKALAQVEAKYARKGHVKRAIQGSPKMNMQRPHAKR